MRLHDASRMTKQANRLRARSPQPIFRANDAKTRHYPNLVRYPG